MELFSPKRDSAAGGRRGFVFYMAAAAVIFLCLQGIFFLLMLDSTIGRFTIFKQQAAADPSLTRDFKVVIVKGESTVQLFPENPAAYYARERYWEDLFTRTGIPYRVVNDRDLTGSLADAAALVLPGTACLGNPQRQAILDFLRSGKGIVASGSLGVRNADCSWHGWDFLAGLTGATGISTVNPVETSYLAFRSEQPFSDKVPAGYLLTVPSQELTLLGVPNPDALLTDWRLRAVQAGGATQPAIASHHASQKGRMVWFGFSEVLPAERPESRQIFDNYTTAAVHWASRQPLAVMADWPDHKRVAVLVAESVHARYDYAQQTAALLKQRDVPATFLLTSVEAGKYPNALQAFRSAGEVASAGDKYEAFTGQSTYQQSERLVKAKQELDRASGQPVVGFAPPFGTADNATILALNDSGYRYYLNEIAVSRAVPEIVEFPSQSPAFPLQKRQVSKIFRVASDDFDLISNYRGPTPPGSELAESFLSEFRRVLYFGGVYPLYFHDYLLGAPEYRGTLNRILDGIKSEPVWIASGRDLVKWWSDRQRVQVTVKKLSPHRLTLDLANMGSDSLEDVTVYVYLPYRAKNIQIRSTLIRLSPPRYQLLERDDVLRIDVAALKGQTDYNYIISLDE